MRSSGNRVLVLFLLLSLLLAGCKTRKMAAGAGIADMEMMELVTASPSVVSPRACLSGNVRLSVSVDSNPFSAKGTIRIKEGNGVQIGMTALGLVEVACLEFLPDNMRLIYKIGKEYTEIPYSDVDFLQSSGISYSLLESVLLNKLFLLLDEHIYLTKSQVTLSNKELLYNRSIVNQIAGDSLGADTSLGVTHMAKGGIDKVNI